MESKAAADTVNKVSVTAWEWRTQPCVESKRAVVRARVLVREMLLVWTRRLRGRTDVHTDAGSGFRAILRMYGMSVWADDFEQAY